jgi:hypothetical protein
MHASTSKAEGIYHSIVARIITEKQRRKEKKACKSIVISDPGYAHGGIPYPGSLGYNVDQSLAVFCREYSSEHHWPPQRKDDFALKPLSKKRICVK